MRASHQPTHALARRLLIEIEARVARGTVGIPEPAPPAPTVAELVDRFLVEYSRPRIKDLAQYRVYARTALRRALPMIGARSVDAVTTAEIQRLRESLGRRSAANSTRLTLAMLGTVFSWAMKSGVVAVNPLKGVELPARRDSVDYLSKEEVRALLAAAERRATAGGLTHRLLHACLHLALHAGLRKGELLGLRWRDLDLDARRLTVARSFRGTPKSGHTRHLRLPEAAAPILAVWSKECPHTADGLVFPIVHNGAPPRLGNHSDMLGLPELLEHAGCRRQARPWHALRHSFAAHFVMSGGNILSLQKILGHADIKMTLIYAHLAPDFLGEEMNKVKF